MNENLVIVFVITIVFLISFSLLFLYFYLYDNGKIVPHVESSVSIKNNTRIFLLGTSYVDALNVEFIKKDLLSDGINADVYNLKNDGRPADIYRLIGSILNEKPNLVVIGVGYRDLDYYIDGRCLNYEKITEYVKTDLNNHTYEHNENKQTVSKSIFSRLIIQDIAKLILPKFIIESNPKEITTNLLRSATDGAKRTSLVDLEGNRLELVDNEYQHIIPIERLNKSYDLKFGVCLEDRDKEITALRKDIKIFKDNGVKVVIFVPPYTKIALDDIPNDAKISFHEILLEITNEFNIEVYDLSSKYETMNIFSDHTHVAKNNKSLIYSNDIGDIIIKLLTE